MNQKQTVSKLSSPESGGIFQRPLLDALLTNHFGCGLPRCAQPIRSVNEGVAEQSGAPPITSLLH
jgi:hypothetical protein